MTYIKMVNENFWMLFSILQYYGLDLEWLGVKNYFW